METLTERTITKTCRKCGHSFSLNYPALAKFVDVCPVCSERQADQDQRDLVLRSATMRAEAWRRICPPDFRDTQPHKLPRPSLLQKVLAWEYGPRGLLLHGETGRGKSRCAWALLKREHQAGRSVRALDAKAALEYGALFSKSCDVAICFRVGSAHRRAAIGVSWGIVNNFSVHPAALPAINASKGSAPRFTNLDRLGTLLQRGSPTASSLACQPVLSSIGTQHTGLRPSARPGAN